MIEFEHYSFYFYIILFLCTNLGLNLLWIFLEFVKNAETGVSPNNADIEFGWAVLKTTMVLSLAITTGVWGIAVHLRYFFGHDHDLLVTARWRFAVLAFIIVGDVFFIASS